MEWNPYSETDENLLKDMFAGGMENLQKDLVCNKLASQRQNLTVYVRDEA